jgi:hypothetical protein
MEKIFIDIHILVDLIQKRELGNLVKYWNKINQ